MDRLDELIDRGQEILDALAGLEPLHRDAPYRDETWWRLQVELHELMAELLPMVRAKALREKGLTR